jgi:hypothetical protein
MSDAPYTEPWLRGTLTDVPAAGRAVLHALDLALDDLTKWTAGLTDAEVHAAPLGLTPIAYHLRHLARSTDRILTYAEGEQLSSEQLAALKAEQGSEGKPSYSPKSKSPSPMPPIAFACWPRPISIHRASLAASSCPRPSAVR